jgi:hypothetical protein
MTIIRMLLAAAVLVTALMCGSFAGAAGAQVPGGFSSGNVEFVSNLKPAGWSNGRLLAKLFYYTTGAGLTIFDASDPDPTERSSICATRPGPSSPATGSSRSAPGSHTM